MMLPHYYTIILHFLILLRFALVLCGVNLSLTDPNACGIFRCADRAEVAHGRAESILIDDSVFHGWKLVNFGTAVKFHRWNKECLFKRLVDGLVKQLLLNHTEQDTAEQQGRKQNI